MVVKFFDMIVIGVGLGGYVVVICGVQFGLNVVCVECEYLGGICLNWGCILIKVLLWLFEVFYLMYCVKEFGLLVDKVDFDLDVVVKWLCGVFKQMEGGIKLLFKKNKVMIIMGLVKISGKGKVIVIGDKGIEELIVLVIVVVIGVCVCELLGLEVDGDLVWIYKYVLMLKWMLKKFLVIGLGVIGIEFVSFYNILGVDMIVVEVMDCVLLVEDKDISVFVKKQFEKQGMKIMEKVMVKKLDCVFGKVIVYIEIGGKVIIEEFDIVILVVGIVGNVEGIGLEEVGVKIDCIYVVINEYCEIGVEGVYVIGDIVGVLWFVYKVSYEGIMVVEKIVGKKVYVIKLNLIVGCIYCYLQVVSVGLIEEKVKEVGYKIKVGKFLFIGNGKVVVLGEFEGLVKIIFDEVIGELLGVYMVGVEVIEMI